MWRKRNLMHSQGSVNECSHCGLSAGGSYGKVKWSYYYDLALTLLGMYQETTFTDKRDNCVPVCTAALLTVAKI